MAIQASPEENERFTFHDTLKKLKPEKLPDYGAQKPWRDTE
jgi:hypothetical protein